MYKMVDEVVFPIKSKSTLKISSGVDAAMSSIDVPPLEEATIMGPPDFLSIIMEIYISRLM